MPVSVQHSPPPLHQPGEVTKRPKGERASAMPCSVFLALQELIHRQAFSKIHRSPGPLVRSVTIHKSRQQGKTASLPRPQHPSIPKTLKKSHYKTPYRMLAHAVPPPPPDALRLPPAAIHQPTLMRIRTMRRTCA